jgi:DegV family protein with EDD domain
MSRVHLLAFLDTLHYLMKGGRVPKAAAWASSLLQIKPLLQILPLSGEASPVGRVRTKPRAVQRLLDIMQRRVPESAAVHAIVMHANVLQDAERLKQALCSRFRCVEVYIKDFTPVMGVHTGPGVLGVAFYAEES